MTFLNPAFLFLLPLAGLPFLIHYLSLHRNKVYVFPLMRYLQKANKDARRKRKLKDWIILVLRCLVILLIVLAFAQPVFSSLNAQKSGRSLIVVDNSFSMQADLGESDLYSEGFRIATKLLEADNTERLPYIQILSERNWYEPASYQDGVNYFVNSSFGIGKMTLAQLVDQIKRTDQQISTVHFISDMQKEVLLGLDSVQQDSSLSIKLYPVQSGSESDVILDSIFISNPLVDLTQRTELNVLGKVRGSGLKDESNRLDLRVLMDGQLKSSKSVQSNEDKIQVGLDLQYSGEQAKGGQVLVEDQVNPFNSRLYFVLNPSIKARTVIISDLKESYLQNVYRNAPFVDFTVVSPGNIDPGILPEVDLVIVHTTEKLNRSLQETIEKTVRNGATLALFPNESNSNIFQSYLKQSKISNKLRLIVPDKNLPFYKGVFKSIRRDTEMPLLRPIQLPHQGNKLMEFSNGQTFLSQSDVGRGKVFLFASNLMEKNGDFGTHSLFLPVMYRIAHTAIGTESLTYNFLDEDFIEVQLTKNNEEFFQLRNAEVTLLPVQKSKGDRLIVQLNEQMQPGIYTVQSVEDSLITLGAVALNIPKSEMNPQTVSSKAIAQLGLANVQVMEGFREDMIKGTLNDSGTWPPYRILVVLILIFLIAEMILLQWGRKS